MLLKTPAGRKNFRQMLVDNGSNRQRLLYELALTCAQVAQVEQFELLVPAMIMEVCVINTGILYSQRMTTPSRQMLEAEMIIRLRSAHQPLFAMVQLLLMCLPIQIGHQPTGLL